MEKLEEETDWDEVLAEVAWKKSARTGGPVAEDAPVALSDEEVSEKISRLTAIEFLLGNDTDGDTAEKDAAASESAATESAATEAPVREVVVERPVPCYTDTIDDNDNEPDGHLFEPSFVDGFVGAVMDIARDVKEKVLAGEMPTTTFVAYDPDTDTDYEARLEYVVDPDTGVVTVTEVVVNESPVGDEEYDSEAHEDPTFYVVPPSGIASYATSMDELAKLTGEWAKPCENALVDRYADAIKRLRAANRRAEMGPGGRFEGYAVADAVNDVLATAYRVIRTVTYGTRGLADHFYSKLKENIVGRAIHAGPKAVASIADVLATCFSYCAMAEKEAASRIAERNAKKLERARKKGCFV